MKSSVKWVLVCLMLGVMATGAFLYEATAGSEDCQAGCELRAKNCEKGCNGDTDCMLNCSDAKSNCTDRCQEKGE